MKGEMKRMPLSVSLSNDERSQPKKLDNLSSQKRSRGAIIVLVSAVFVIFFILAYMTSPPSSHTSLFDANVVERPEDLQELLMIATERGIDAQSLIPIRKSDTELVTQSSVPVSLLCYLTEPTSLWSLTWKRQG